VTGGEQREAVKQAGVTHVLGIPFRSFFGNFVLLISQHIINKIYFFTPFVSNKIFERINLYTISDSNKEGS
jgi:hypothetical protein